MRQFVSATLVGSCLISGLILSLGAQSLADVARKEEERRKTIHEPAKVYTNKDLASPPPSSAPAAKTAETKEDPVAARAKDARDKGQDPAKDAAKEKEPVKDKAYWAGRQKALQDQIDRDKTEEHGTEG